MFTSPTTRTVRSPPRAFCGTQAVVAGAGTGRCRRRPARRCRLREADGVLGDGAEAVTTTTATAATASSVLGSSSSRTARPAEPPGPNGMTRSKTHFSGQGSSSRKPTPSSSTTERRRDEPALHMYGHSLRKILPGRAAFVADCCRGGPFNQSPPRAQAFRLGVGRRRRRRRRRHRQRQDAPRPPPPKYTAGTTSSRAAATSAWRPRRSSINRSSTAGRRGPVPAGTKRPSRRRAAPRRPVALRLPTTGTPAAMYSYSFSERSKASMGGTAPWPRPST